jgi:serine/threonine-protein kinase HipA
MSSEPLEQVELAEPAEQAYVWVFLPGETSPTLCGRFEHRLAPGGHGVGRFVYGRRFLEHRFATALDPVALPLKERLFETVGLSQGVFGVFADACPDDWGRYVIDRQFGVQAYPIGYLLHSQEDRVGNLAFSRGPGLVPELLEPTARAMLDQAWAVVAGLDAGRSVDPDLATKIRANTALGGARPKLTVADESAQWLAKFPSKRDDPRWSQARLEAAMLDLARLCGINAAQAQIHAAASLDTHDPTEAVDRSKADILLVQRFDRTLAGTAQIDSRAQPGPDTAHQPKKRAWLRDAYVSARTVMLSAAAGGPLPSFSGSYATLARELGRWSARPAADRLELFRRMVAADNYLERSATTILSG